MTSPTPRLILETLFPYLRTAAAYAQCIQAKIATLPEKMDTDNFFAAALTDADLSIQTFVEVVLLGKFPNIRFYGEEYEKAYNTRYFRALDLGPQDDYLVTLDPIDGTQFYLDGHNNYQILLGVLNRDEFEAVIAISPAQNTYYYALRGEGAFQGSLDQDLDACAPLRVAPQHNTVYLGWSMGELEPFLRDRYTVLNLKSAYSSSVQVSNVNGMLNGELTGAVIRSGKFIDGAALAFLAQETGCIVTTHDGSPPPPLYACDHYQRPGLVIASSATVHQDILAAIAQLSA